MHAGSVERVEGHRLKRRFSDVLRAMRPEIHRIAYAGQQRVPGMSPQEIEAEMLYVLWKARMSYSYDNTLTFPAYWWVCWMNHKRDLLKFYFRVKRDVRKEFLFDDATEQELHAAFPVVMEEAHPVLPETCSMTPDLERVMWHLLASGVELGALHTQYGKATVDTIILSWRSNPKVRKALT